MAERPLYTLYKNLKAQNYDVPDDYNKFESALTRDGKGGADNRHAIYENLKAQNFDVPNTYERFYSALFEPRSKTSSRAKGGSVPMSAADRARFSAGAAAISASASNAVRQAKRNIQTKLGQAKKFYGGRVTPRLKNPLQNQNVQKNEFNYNSTTGKTGTYTTTDGVEFDNEYDAAQYQNQLDKQGEQYINAVNTGEIPSVFDVRDKNGNYDLQENINKNGTYLTEEGARNQFDKKLADAYARKKEIEALIAEDHRQYGNPLLSYGASIGASNGRTAEQSDYSNKLATSLALVKQQIGALEAVKQYPTSSWGEDALKAFDNTAFTAKTWDFGLTDFATMGQMERIKTKMDNNLPLSGSDKMLLKSKLGADAAAALEDEKMGNIYRWTKIAGQSLPFMADFFLTGGYGGITKAISRGALKFAAKRGMGKVSAAILKNTGIVAGDVIGSYAMAGSEQAMKTGADIMQRHLGSLYQDEKGDYKFGTFDENGNLLHEGGESMGTALYKGLTSAMVENYTEKLFGHSYGIKKGAINFMEKHGMNASAEFFKNIGKSGWYTNSKKWMEKFGINGFGEEVMEEEIGIPLHALLDGDNKFSDLLDTKQQLDIIGGMALSVGSMYAMGAGSRPVKGVYNRAQYYRFRNKVNVADSDAQNLMGDKWADIKDKIDNTTNEQMGGVLADILRQRDTMSKDQINAAINYGINLMKMRGYNVAKTAEMNAREITNEPTTPEEQHQEDIDNAYSEGHDADDADKHDIQLEHEDQTKTLAGLLNISEQQLSAMNDDELQSLTGQNDKLDQAIYDYQLSSARYQGVTDDAQDKIDMAANQAAQRVDMYTDKSRGSVRNATVKASGGAEDYGVYIISGNIATNEDGSINVADSDDMILFYDPTTNSVEHADALRFAELGDEVPADDVKAQAVADAKEKAIKEVAGIVDGTIDVGSQFKVTGADGLEHTYEILADYGDGTAAISIDGNVVENPYSLEDLQHLKDLEDQKRLEAAKAQREQMEMERAEQTQETEQPEEIQPSLDFNQILNDDGNVVLVDVLDKDGNTKYPDSRLFLIRDTGAKAKVVELKSDGTFVPHAVSKKNVATISSMSLDEYKQAMAETSMIEENSGAIEGDRGGIEVNDELPPVPDNVTINGDGTYSVDGAVQGGENTTAPAEQTEQTPAMTLEDGTIVPMLEDGNPDFSKLTADQTAELYDSQFGEDADSVISGWVSDAKKALDKANNMTVKGKNFVEQKAAKEAKEKAIADAQAAYDSAVAIRDAYNERQLAKVEDTADGRKNLIEKARRKFSRLKSAVKDDAEAVSQLYKDVVGSLLHRLYDGTGIDVTDTIPLTAEEYVASNLGAHSLNYEGTETSKGVKQETGLSREDFAKTQLLAADGKGTTIDDLVHSLWENRPSNLESLDTQDIRNALIGVLNSGFKASEARNYIENLRIAQAENILEEQKKAADNAAFAEEQKAKQEEEEKKAEENAEEKTHSEAFNKIVDLAKNLEKILDNPDNVKEIDKITHEIDELLETLSDEEFKEVSDVLLNIDEDLEYLTADEYERREGVEESKKAKAYNESLQQAIKRIAPYADALKAAVKSGDKKAIAKAQKELTDALLASTLGHGYLSGQLEYAKSAKKKEESYSERRALVKPLTDAINAIESALDSALAEAGLEGVHVDFTEGGHGWIYADKGSAWSSRLKPLDNDYRNIAQYDGINYVSSIPQITLDNVAKVAGIIKSQIEEGERYNSDEYNDEDEQTNEIINAPEQNNFPDKLREGRKAIEVPEDATDENPLGAQRDQTDLPFSAKENGKQQTTAERAADVEKNKVDDMKVVDNIVGEKTRKAFERLAKMMGASIQWQYSDKLGNGWIQETTDADGNVHRTIFITLDSSITEGAQFIFGHEMTHQIKKLNPAAYNELTQLVLDTYGSDAYDKAVDETMKRYSDAGFSGRARDYYAEEVVADAVGEMIRDLNLAHTLAMKMSHPLLAAIHEILQKIKLAFFGTEYSDVTKNIIRSIEQAYVKTAKGEVTNPETGEDVSFSLRQKPEPKKKGIGYKVFVLKDGKLYPPMVANPNGAATPVGVWLDADAAPIAGESKTGRPQVKQGGKGTQGGSGKLAYRPGWHLGVVPYAIQFNRKDAEGNKTLFPKNFVFAEVEYAADVDYQEEARQEGINPSGKYQHSLAGLKHLPTDGYYMYRTNPNPETDPWVITGAMKVNRILTRAEQAELVKNAGREPQQIQEGDIVTDDVVNSINQEIADAPKFSLKVYHGTGASFDKFDLSHALEGEGSESFGHGVYVTNSSKIGREYAQRAKNRKMEDLYKNMRYPDGVKGDIFKRRVFGEMVNDVATGGSVASAKEFAKKRIGADANDIQRTLENLKDREKGTEYEQNLKNRLAEYKEGLKWIDSLDEDYLTQGNTNRYDVDIPDDNGSNYLDWEGTIPDSLDKQKVAEDAYKVVSNNQGFNDFKATPLNDFIAHTLKTYVNTTDVAGRVEKLKSDIKDVIENYVADDDVLALNEYLKDATPDDVLATIWYNDLVRDIKDADLGEELYRKLSTYVGDNAASKILADNGLVGIKYPAGIIHGGAEEGDYNYVIFDENNANIVGNTRFSLRYDKFEHDLNQWKKDNNMPKDAKRPTIPQRNAGESAVDFLMRVDEYRKQMALWKTAPTYEQHLLSDDTALGEFNRELQKGSVLKRIAFQDSMLAIRKAQEAIMKEVGVDRLNMAEDAYTAENRSHGKGKNEFEEYNNEFLQPLRKAYHQMKKVLGDSYDNVRVYMMAKHGLERDAQMAFKKSLEADYEDVNQRSVAYKAYKNDLDRVSNDADLEFGRVDFTTWRQKDNALRGKYSPSYMDYRYDDNGIAYDYSGLSSLFDGSDFEEAAHRLVRDVETKHLSEVQALWNATNAATKKILRDGFKAGMMSKDAYEYVKGMYSHYIPLRGWDGTTADQVWDYIGGGKGAFNQTLKTAHGRTSIADDPIAYIENMAESGILLNNKNWVKQHLMLLAQNHPTSLLTLSKAWYVKSTDANGNEEWIPATPQITSQMNSNQVKAAIDAFEQKMEQMAQTGDATQQRDGLNIAYPQTHSEEREHEVRVMKDGEEYVIYVNGDPQLAQAMNNTRAHRVREIQSGKLDRAAAWLGRKMAAAYTSLSPLFIPSNYFRDLTMTLASTAIREDGRYNYLLRKNLATSWNLGFMLRDYQNGKLREKVNNGNATAKEQMFYDFMMNGGETGFVSSLDVEDLKKKFKNDLKDLDRWKANPVKVGHTIMDGIEFLNRAIEDSNRFAVYMTSIQYGRSIDEAVNDAKDVTLNFNRKGTGEYGWQMIRNLYLFINPAVQSLQTLGALTKHHPFKFTAVTAAWLASGVLVPIVNAALMSLLGGDDDKDKYWQFSKWDRRNNAIMWIPFTNEYVKIPLAQEFRAFYGIGDMIASKMMGGELAEETWSQYAEDLLGQVVYMLPLDPTGYDGNIAVSLMPNPIRPVFELAFNVDFTGKPLFKDTEYNKYDPNFTKAYVGTPDWLVRVSKMVNSIGNDYPDVQQNAIDAFGDPRYNLNNPAVVDHVLSSYLGGAYTMGSQVLGVLTKSLNDPKEIKMADIPLVSKFVSNPDDRPVTKKQGDEFWNMKENHDRAANTLSKLKKQAKVDGDYSILERFYGSEEYKQYKQEDVKVKKYEEDKKKERAEESGEEYRPHKLSAEDIYKAHATPKDDFEDLKLKQLFTKLNGFKTSYDLLVDTAPGQSDGYYNTNKAAIDAIDEISLDKQEISELKKGFLEDGKDAYNAEDMKRIRELRKRILSVLEPANKVVVANQKAKAEK